MAKITNFFIISLLLAAIGILIFIAADQKSLQTTPLLQEPTPKAPWLETEPQIIEEQFEQETPSPRAPEPTEPPGVPFEKIYAQSAEFFVNNIRVGEINTYNYIPIKKSQVKTFAGTFGPYAEDPSPYVRVELCAELVDFPSKPACEIVQTLYREEYMNFARGYQFDEYIGAQAAKDYTAYYTVYVGDTAVANGPRARIRTVND